MITAELSVGREARRDLAIWAVIDAHEDGDHELLGQRIREMFDLDERLRAEQLAELGYMPTTFAGCVAVLAVAARIIRVIGSDDDLD